MANTLAVGELRTGSLTDYDESTPETQVLLERRTEGICTTVSWSRRDSPYAHWFWHGRWGPLETTRSPDRLSFLDSNGWVQLLQCWTQGFHANMAGPGSGRVWARYAVLDAHPEIDYGTVHAMRSQISGVRGWLGQGSWTGVAAPTGGVAFQFAQHRLPPVDLGAHDGLQLSFVPNAGFSWPNGDSQAILRDDYWFMSAADEAQPWDRHLALAQGVRDLVTLSRWWPEVCVPTWVHRDDDPEVTLAETPIGPAWRSVVVADEEEARAPSRPRPHLIPFSELSGDGLRRWLELRDAFARALDPILTFIRLDALPMSTRLAHLGPAVEALGYLLDLEDGTAETKAANRSLRWRLGRISDEVAGVVPFSSDEWTNVFTSAYNGIKHANRVLPVEDDLRNSLVGSVQTVRAWVALRLGIDRELVAGRIRPD